MLTPFLKSKVKGLRVTTVEARYSLEFDGAVVVGERLAWAAGWTEFQVVEVRNLVRCTRFAAQVMFGPEGEVQVWSNALSLTQPGDAVHVSAYAWLTPEQITAHEAALVLVGKENAPIEIRRIKTRRVPLDPSFFPPPPRDQTFLLKPSVVALADAMANAP